MNVDEVIGSAKPEMRQMLESVYLYNLQFTKTTEERKLLLKILEAMSAVDRKFFVTDRTCAYEDTALSIGEGQTISQPSTVARTLLLAELKQGDNVLEIGTGSGWNASLIAFLVYPGNVTSAERIFPLLRNARNNIEIFKKHLKNNRKLSKIKLIAKDIFIYAKKWNDKCDKIIFTAGISNSETEKDVLDIPRKLLKKNGILICPYTSGPMLIAKKGKDNKIRVEKTREEYVFVPLVEGVE